MRLDVAVDQTLRVRSIQRCGDLTDDPDRTLGLKGTALKEFVKVLAAYQPHIDVEVPVDLTPVVNRDHMGFFQHRRSTRLPLKPGPEPVIAGQLLRQNLQRHRPVFTGVTGLVHLTHTALPEQPVELVLAKHRAGLACSHNTSPYAPD